MKKLMVLTCLFSIGSTMACKGLDGTYECTDRKNGEELVFSIKTDQNTKIMTLTDEDGDTNFSLDAGVQEINPPNVLVDHIAASGNRYYTTQTNYDAQCVNDTELKITFSVTHQIKNDDIIIFSDDPKRDGTNVLDEDISTRTLSLKGMDSSFIFSDVMKGWDHQTASISDCIKK